MSDISQLGGLGQLAMAAAGLAAVLAIASLLGALVTKLKLAVYLASAALLLCAAGGALSFWGSQSASAELTALLGEEWVAEGGLEVLLQRGREVTAPARVGGVASLVPLLLAALALLTSMLRRAANLFLTVTLGGGSLLLACASVATALHSGFVRDAEATVNDALQARVQSLLSRADCDVCSGLEQLTSAVGYERLQRVSSDFPQRAQGCVDGWEKELAQSGKVSRGKACFGTSERAPTMATNSHASDKRRLLASPLLRNPAQRSRITNAKP